MIDFRLGSKNPKLSRLNFNGIEFSNFFTAFYQFLHRGRCKNGYACETRDCNTIEATVMDCRNRCASRGEHIGYFAYVPATQVCACYTKEGKCGDDWKYQNTLNEYYWDHHWAFEILRPTDVVSQGR